MRAAVLLLLLANLLVFLWYTQIHKSEPSLPEAPYVSVEKRLLLVSEYQAQQQAEQAAGQQPQPSDSTPAESQPTTASAATAAATLATSNPTPAPVEQAEPTESSTTPPPAEQAAEVTATVCYTLGPFKVAEQAKAATQRFSELGAIAQWRRKIEPEQYGYQVFLPPYPSRDDAIQAAQRLAQYGIRDYFIITEDPAYRNGISLGLFRQKTGAVRRMAQVRRFDFTPQMEARYRDVDIYWLDYQWTPGVAVEPYWAQLRTTTPGLQRLARACPLPTAQT